VQDWVYRYRDGGVAALEDKPRPGKPCKLDPQEQQRFRRRILVGPGEADGVCTLRGPEARKILEAEFGKNYSLPAVYPLMLCLLRLRSPLRGGMPNLPRHRRGAHQERLQDHLDRARGFMR
jgi:hypothetical protein